MKRAEFIVPVCANDQEVFDVGMSDEMVDESEGCGVKPLKVIKKKGKRVFFPGEYAEEPPENRLEPVLRFLRWKRRNRRLLTDDQDQALG